MTAPDSESLPLEHAERLDTSRTVVPAHPAMFSNEPDGTAITRADKQTDPILAMMDRALAMGPDGVAALEKLADLYDRGRKQANESAYRLALSKFQEECPPVPTDAKLTHLKRVNREGVQTAVGYHTTQQLRDHMQPHLARNGFSLSLDQEVEGDMLVGIATLHHEQGHSASARFKLPTKTSTPAMSPQQAYAAAYSFACRMALRSVTGVRLTDEEDDDAGVDPTTISEEQAATIQALIEETGSKTAKVLEFAKANSVAEIRAVDYGRVVDALESYRKRVNK